MNAGRPSSHRHRYLEGTASSAVMHEAGSGIQSYCRVVAQVHEKAKVSQFRRQVVFRVGEEDWPYLEAAAKEHGSIQAGVIAALRAQAVRRLAPEAEATPADVSPTSEVAV